MSLRWLINLVLPGTILFLVFGLCLGVALLYGSQRMRRIGRLWLLLLALFHLAASTRAGADVMLAPLLRHTDFIQDADAAQGSTAVVLLNAGASIFSARGYQFAGIGREASLRAIEAARVYRLLGDPLVIVAGGYPELTDRPSLGAIFSATLVDLGVPATRIVIEPNSRNTRQHAENLKPYLEKHGVKRFVMVTSAVHMRRSIATFRAAGYDFVPSAAPVYSDFEVRFSRLAVGEVSLDRITWGAHEYAGLLYYWWKGWL